MKNLKVNVPWERGLYVLPAAQLARLAATFGSRITLRCGRSFAEATNVLSMLALCACLGASIEIEAHGADEVEAAAAIEGFF